MQAFEKLRRTRAQNKVVSLYLIYTMFTLQKWAKPCWTEPCWPCCTNHTGLVWPSSLQFSFITVYTVKQTGLTRAGPQKYASVNIVLNISPFYFRTYGAALFVLTEEDYKFFSMYIDYVRPHKHHLEWGGPTNPMWAYNPALQTHSQEICNQGLC